jgi:hypothetical protein
MNGRKWMEASMSRMVIFALAAAAMLYGPAPASSQVGPSAGGQPPQGGLPGTGGPTPCNPKSVQPCGPGKITGGGSTSHGATTPAPIKCTPPYTFVPRLNSCIKLTPDTTHLVPSSKHG